MRPLALLVVMTRLTTWAWGDEPGEAERIIVERAVKAAGGADHLPKIVRWKERYYIGDAKSGADREAIVRFPDAWFQNGQNIAKGNADRTEKAYLAGLWTLQPLTDAKSRLKVIPAVTVNDRSADGLRVSRDEQKDIDMYFDRETGRLARIDWRAFQVYFSDWQEADGFHYPSKAQVRRSDGSLHVRTEFLEMQRLTELPEGLTP